MIKILSDKEKEKNRYNRKASEFLLENKDINAPNLFGSLSIPIYLRESIEDYEDLVKKNVLSSHSVLELGCGIGTHTEILLKTKAKITTLDISKKSLDILHNKFINDYINFKTLEADIERIPLANSSIDIICSAGSISYGKSELVMSEIIRILKPNGLFIITDSLNNNPIYIFNRWISYLLGKRTLGTMKNMLNIKKIYMYRNNFILKELNFYGSIIWMVPIFKLFLSDIVISTIIRKFDKMINVKKTAFKFTSIMKKNNMKIKK